MLGCGCQSRGLEQHAQGAADHAVAGRVDDIDGDDDRSTHRACGGGRRRAYQAAVDVQPVAKSTGATTPGTALEARTAAPVSPESTSASGRGDVNGRGATARGSFPIGAGRGIRAVQPHSAHAMAANVARESHVVWRAAPLVALRVRRSSIIWQDPLLRRVPLRRQAPATSLAARWPATSPPDRSAFARMAFHHAPGGS